MRMFRKEGEVTMPREVGPVPMVKASAEIEKFAPKRYQTPANSDDDRERYASGLQAFDELRNDLQTANSLLRDALDDVHRKDANIARLELELAQAKNDVANATAITQDAVRAAADWHALFQNIQAMMSGYEIGAVPTISAARKAKKKNGDALPPASFEQAAESPPPYTPNEG